MKWFLALAAASPGLPVYADLLRVAVWSARRHAPALRPHLLFDGELPTDWGWLAAAGVEVIPRRSFLHSHLAALPDPNALAIGGGAYLRLELPALAAERGWDDRLVLYTDLDVQFVGDPLPLLEPLAPRFFAAAPEDRSDRLSLNTGVMLMNLPALRREDERFRRFALKHLAHCTRRTWDQEAYRLYYSTRLLPHPAADERLARFTRPLRRRRWDDLPLGLNWRPYWGPNSAAKIIHFHGPKPSQAPYFRLPSEERPPQLAAVGPLATDHYFALTAGWLATLAEASG